MLLCPNEAGPGQCVDNVNLDEFMARAACDMRGMPPLQEGLLSLPICLGNDSVD